VDILILEKSGPLTGTVDANGSKNSSLPIMAACLLTEEESVLDGVPQVTDVLTMAEILRTLGASVTWEDHRVRIRPGAYTGWTAPYELVSRMRASICVLGPLLAKQGRANVAMPGGCVIGPRPIDLHLKGLEALGARMAMEHGCIVAEAEQLRGASIHLVGPFGSSVLATGNVMMAATLAEGETVIQQAACEPEVVDLANMLVAMGAKISGQGTPVIHIRGVHALHGAQWRVIPDRIETGTLLLATAIVGGDVTIRGAQAAQVSAVVEKLIEAGVTVEARDGGLRVRAAARPQAIEVTTLPFPGFPTDLQALATVMMTLSRGVSMVREQIYPERFMHVPELKRMGAEITREGHSAIIKGIERLSGAPVVATDLRAAAALVLAGLAADGCTELRGVEHLDRGYEGLERKLVSLGARIRREQR
jgi:UDP-N-acetylglucosamine 1-carboxyvinyltransferase